MYKSLHKVTVRACDGATMSTTGGSSFALLCSYALLYNPAGTVGGATS